MQNTYAQIDASLRAIRSSGQNNVRFQVSKTEKLEMKNQGQTESQN